MTFPDVDDYKAHEKLMDVTWNASTSGKVCQAFVNHLVTVCVGPLFGDRDEFHLQATRNFLMPEMKHTEACATAAGFWERSALFYGVPFKGDLTESQVNLVLTVFGKQRRIATTVVCIPASSHCPCVLLIGSAPASMPTAINSQGAHATTKDRTTMDPSHAKWACYHRAPDADAWHHASAAHIGLTNLFANHPEVMELLEVRYFFRIIYTPGGTFLWLAIFHCNVLPLSPKCAPGGTVLWNEICPCIYPRGCINCMLQ